MIRLLFSVIAYLFLINLNGQNLEQHEWNDRILIVKAESEASKTYQNQIEELRNSSSALKERKLMIYQVIGNKYELVDYDNPEIIGSGEVSNQMNVNILNKKIPFEIILIGLDGGIKLKKSDIIRKEELFNLIDSMPMRSSELSNKN
ncbi:MAG: DUF4174 domain-containing protein [Flavobacteriales bacterium]|nr:DUF4174 domain-containing protein [Flavobacteriales bacterium]